MLDGSMAMMYRYLLDLGLDCASDSPRQTTICAFLNCTRLDSNRICQPPNLAESSNAHADRRQTLWVDPSNAPARHEVNNADLYGAVEPLPENETIGSNVTVNDDGMSIDLDGLVPRLVPEVPPDGIAGQQCTYTANGGCRDKQTTTLGPYCKLHSCSCGAAKRSRSCV